MTMLQEQAVQMIRDMSDDNVGFLIEVIQRLIPKKTYTSVIYPSQRPDEKMQAFKELVATRNKEKKINRIYQYVNGGIIVLGLASIVIIQANASKNQLDMANNYEQQVCNSLLGREL